MFPFHFCLGILECEVWVCFHHFSMKSCYDSTLFELCLSLQAHCECMKGYQYLKREVMGSIAELLNVNHIFKFVRGQMNITKNDLVISVLIFCNPLHHKINKIPKGKEKMFSHLTFPKSYITVQF